MSIREVGRTLGLSHRTVWRLLAAGQLARVHVSARRVGVPAGSVARYLAALNPAPPATRRRRGGPT